MKIYRTVAGLILGDHCLLQYLERFLTSLEVDCSRSPLRRFLELIIFVPHHVGTGELLSLLLNEIGKRRGCISGEKLVAQL